MFAAKSGHSTLGIPQSVGADFVAATPSAHGLPAHASPHRPASSVEAMTGLPSGRTSKRPVRRGGGRMKAKGPQQHLNAIQSHLAAGNHGAAKTSALNLAKALHQLTSGASGASASATNTGNVSSPIPSTPAQTAGMY